MNGLHVSENVEILQNILRKEWGWKGMTMSDWFGTYSTVEALQAGLDLEMPGPAIFRGTPMERALASGKVQLRDLDDSVRKVSNLDMWPPSHGLQRPTAMTCISRCLNW